MARGHVLAPLGFSVPTYKLESVNVRGEMNTCKMLSTVLGIQVGVAALMPAILASKFKVSLGYRAEMLSQKKKPKPSQRLILSIVKS